MSFRINTNVTALNALNNLNNNSDMLSQSITRLSTGLRINSAADDPAGLIISQKYQAQISGLGQAINNSQDGVNYAKTADGALQEVSNLLQTARTLAVAAANTGTLSAPQLQADQSQIQAIAQSITRISTNTQFGTKKLLDGSSGVQASITDATKLASLSIGGTFNGTSLSVGGAVAMTISAAATQATATSKALATAGTLVGAGSFTINGVTFTTTAATTAQNETDMINAASAQTGVVALFDLANTRIDLNTTAYGSGQKINLTDANGVIRFGGAGSSAYAGTDALGSLTVNGGAAALFTGSKGGHDGLTLTDADGNTFTLTQSANATGGPFTVGQVNIGSAQFQIGANANQTTTLSLGNFAASQLGTGVAAGVNFSNIDLTTANGATQAIQVIDAAIDQITTGRGQIGSFQADILQSNIRSLSVAQENLSAANSTISDTDVAAEMTNFTKEQILQQTGISVLAQANQLPQGILKLLQ